MAWNGAHGLRSKWRAVGSGWESRRPDEWSGRQWRDGWESQRGDAGENYYGAQGQEALAGNDDWSHPGGHPSQDPSLGTQVSGHRQPPGPPPTYYAPPAPTDNAQATPAPEEDERKPLINYEAIAKFNGTDAEVGEEDAVVEAAAAEKRTARARKTKGAPRLWCEILLRKLHHKNFELVPMLIGRSGSKMKLIHQQTNAKVRIRGRGSGYLEVEGKKEAPVPLMIVITQDGHLQEKFVQAVEMVVDLVRDVAVRFRTFCKTNDFTAAKGHLYTFGEISPGAMEAFQQKYADHDMTLDHDFLVFDAPFLSAMLAAKKGMDLDDVKLWEAEKDWAGNDETVAKRKPTRRGRRVRGQPANADAQELPEEPDPVQAEEPPNAGHAPSRDTIKFYVQYGMMCGIAHSERMRQRRLQGEEKSPWVLAPPPPPVLPEREHANYAMPDLQQPEHAHYHHAEDAAQGELQPDEMQFHGHHFPEPPGQLHEHEARPQQHNELPDLGQQHHGPHAHLQGYEEHDELHYQDEHAYHDQHHYQDQHAYHEKQGYHDDHAYGDSDVQGYPQHDAYGYADAQYQPHGGHWEQHATELWLEHENYMPDPELYKTETKAEHYEDPLDDPFWNETDYGDQNQPAAPPEQPEKVQGETAETQEDLDDLAAYMQAEIEAYLKGDSDGD